MSRSTVHGNAKETALPQTPPGLQADHTERRFRRVSLWVILYLLLQAELGLAWDRRWHDYLGRDQFWIPPHIMIYTGVGVAGLLTLIVVLVETVRYWRHAPGVDDSSTISVLRYFHAPLGFILLGFGALVDLIAAPLDNYWHELYGIDVTLWAPFHLMGTFGGILIGLGIIYATSSEAVYDRLATYPVRRFLGLSASEWACLIFLAAFIELALPALTAFESLPFGSWQLITYPLPLALAGGVVLVSAVQVTRKPGAATITALLLGLLCLFTQSFVLEGLLQGAAILDLVFRVTAGVPVFNLAIVLMPLLFICAALLIDGMAYVQKRCDARRFEQDGLRSIWLVGLFVAIPAWLFPSWIVLLLKYVVPVVPLPMDVATVLEPTASEVLLVGPLVILLGIAAAMLGAIFGDIWHWNKR
jgi:hypothetical protein